MAEIVRVRARDTFDTCVDLPQDLLVHVQHALHDGLEREILTHELVIDVEFGLQELLLIVQHVPRVQMLYGLVLGLRFERLQLVDFLLVERIQFG